MLTEIEQQRLARVQAVVANLDLLFQKVPCYARSRQFVLGQDHDLDQVLQILKQLTEIVGQEAT